VFRKIASIRWVAVYGERRRQLSEEPSVSCAFRGRRIGKMGVMSGRQRYDLHPHLAGIIQDGAGTRTAPGDPLG
jgi:hypothetical protein